VSLYKKQPRSLIVREDGSGSVNWSFDVQFSKYDATILAAGKVAEALMQRTIRLERKNDDDEAQIRKLGYPIRIAEAEAFSILTKNMHILERYNEFVPRPGKEYRLLTHRTLRFLLDDVK
jgi:hypothetical protein